MLLAIDTATRLMSLALHDGRQLLAEETWHTANNHTTELPPAIQALLARSALSLDDVTALAVSMGPGSFTGLRIGVALAKGIASARNLPLVGVSTHDTLAAGQPPFARHALIAVVEAGRGRIIAATYRWSQGQWVHRGEPRLMNWEALLTTIDGPAYITGAVSDEGHGALADAQAAGIPIKLVPSALRLRRAGFLAQTALERLDAGTEDFHPSRLAPIYIKTKDIP